MDVDGQRSRRYAFVEGDVVDDVEWSPFNPRRLPTHPDASCSGRRAVEDALAVEMYRIIVGVGSLPVDLYRTYSHISSEVDLDFMPALSER